MKYGSVCSGVEAASVAWHPLGWEPQWFSEIEKFPSAVLANHYPDVPNFGDMTKFKEWPNDRSIDLLVGGTPCQSFSVAGLRKGLDDPRGNLMLTYLAIAERYRPRWLVWENVPGVLSSNKGRDFGTFLGALGKLNYGFASRVLDAQYFNVAQRRKRVFVVGHLGDWRPAAAVLFERESLSGNTAPRRTPGQSIAPTVTQGPPFSRTGNERVECEAIVPVIPEVAGSLDTECGGGKLTHQSAKNGHLITVAFPAEMSGTQPASTTELSPSLAVTNTTAVAWSIMPMNSGKDYKARHVDVAQPLMAGGPVGGNQGGDFVQSTPAVAIGIDHDYNAAVELMGPLIRGPQGSPRNAVMQSTAVALPLNTQIVTRGEALGKGTGFGLGSETDPSYTLQAAHSHAVYESSDSAVRRLTATECERLQGFPDNYTKIAWRGKISDYCPDGPRYKAMGNSMAVPVMRWIGERINAVENIKSKQEEKP